jgi:hypothetical protein
MRKFNTIPGIVLLTILLMLTAPKISKAQQSDYISDQEFYDDLQPYGTWISDPDYGNVWVPDTGDDDFKPYATHGYWALTDYGNTWISDYPWGWATFHYGRWHYDKYYGWEWVPGHQWGPAWVSWKHGGGYYGWAPLLPGISIRLSLGGAYYVPDHYWTCVPENYINSSDVYNHYVPHSQSVTILNNANIISNTYVKHNRTYIIGPRPEEISQVTHQQPQIYKINKAAKPGNDNIQNNAVNMYRPAVHKSAQAHPARVVDGTAYKQQNPNQAIAHRGAGGTPSHNRINAAKLSMIAKTPKPDNKIVHINPVNNPQGFVKSDHVNPSAQRGIETQQPAPPQPEHQHHGQQPAQQIQQAGQPAQTQQDHQHHGQQSQQAQQPAQPQQDHQHHGQQPAQPGQQTQQPAQPQQSHQHHGQQGQQTQQPAQRQPQVQQPRPQQIQRPQPQVQRPQQPRPAPRMAPPKRIN